MGKNRRRRKSNVESSENQTVQQNNETLQEMEADNDENELMFAGNEDDGLDLDLTFQDIFSNTMEENEEIIKKVYGSQFLDDLKKMGVEEHNPNKEEENR